MLKIPHHNFGLALIWNLHYKVLLVYLHNIILYIHVYYIFWNLETHCRKSQMTYMLSQNRTQTVLSQVKQKMLQG